MAGREELQSAGMLSREQLLHLFNRFALLTAQPDVKKRIADAVKDGQEAVAVTTAIQDCVFLEMSIGKTVMPTLLSTSSNFTVSFPSLLKLPSNFTMSIDSRFGISCLGKVNMFYENDPDLMIQFYKFVANEEMACDEADLGPTEFTDKMNYQQKLQEQQLEMLKHMRKYHLDDQSVVLEMLRQQMENANFEGEASVLSPEQIQETIRRRVSPLLGPR